MSTITTRSGKGAPLTNNEVDSNFTNLNTDKAELSGATFTGDVKFGDNDKATFGASDDLQIYHDGSNSYISDQGTGSLKIAGADVEISTVGGNKYFSGSANIATLFHTNNPKLATTATGIDVTGTATMDGLVVDGLNSSMLEFTVGATAGRDAYSSSPKPSIYVSKSSAGSAPFNSIGNLIIQSRADAYGRDINFVTGATTSADLRLNIAGNGDISFYEDTGTTPKMVWSASAESLRLGSTPPQTPAIFNLRSNGTNIEFGHHNSTSGYFGTLGASANNGLPYLGFSAHADGGYVNTFTTKGFKGNVIQGDTSGNLTFNQLTNANASGQSLAERMRIDSAGFVGIGTSSPDRKLEIVGIGTTVKVSAASVSSTNTAIQLGGYAASANSAYGAHIRTYHNFGVSGASSLAFETSGAQERMRIDSAGNLLVGTSNTTWNSAEGLRYFNGDALIVTRNADAPLFLNRLSNDGSIAEFTKDGATVGSIGTNTGNIYLSDGVRGLAIDGDTIYGTYSTGGNANGAQNLGSATQRFKDLHLSGNVYANALIHEGDSNTYVAFLPDRIYMDRGGNRAFDADSGSTRFGRPNGTEAMRIDSAGNLLVNTTNPAAGYENTEAGIVLGGSDNYTIFSRTGNIPLFLNRNSTDGTIADFRKDGTTVGSIGTAAGTFWIGSGDTGLVFDNATSNSEQIRPYNTATGTRDAAIDLGSAGGRFKDLYLSGGVHLGGTGAANKLDDYEEGTWTPTFIGSTSGTMAVTNVVTSKYVKVGTLVTLSVYCTCNGTTNDLSGAVQITSLPFTAVSEMGVGVSPYSGLFTNNDAVFVRALGSSLRLVKGSSKANYTDGDVLTNSTVLPFMITVSYHTN